MTRDEAIRALGVDLAMVTRDTHGPDAPEFEDLCDQYEDKLRALVQPEAVPSRRHDDPLHTVPAPPEAARCDCGKSMEACAENAYIAFGGSSNKPAPPETGSVYWTPSQIRTERWHSEQRFVTAADYDRVVASEETYRNGYLALNTRMAKVEELHDAAQAENERLRAHVNPIDLDEYQAVKAERGELRKIVEAVARIACDNEHTSPNRLDAIVSVVGRRAK